MGQRPVPSSGCLALELLDLLGFAHALDPGSHPSIDDVVPVLLRVQRELHEPLDEEDAGVADLSRSLLHQLETLLEQKLIALAVSEPGAGRILSQWGKLTS